MKGSKSGPGQDEDRTTNLEVEPHRSPFFFKTQRLSSRITKPWITNHLSSSSAVISIVIISIKMFTVKILSCIMTIRDDLEPRKGGWRWVGAFFQVEFSSFFWCKEALTSLGYSVSLRIYISHFSIKWLSWNVIWLHLATSSPLLLGLSTDLLLPWCQELQRVRLILPNLFYPVHSWRGITMSAALDFQHS